MVKMTETRENNSALKLVEKIKQGCDRYRELCILGRDEESSRLKEALDGDIDDLQRIYQSLPVDERNLVDKCVTEAYRHLADATHIITGQINGLARRLER